MMTLAARQPKIEWDSANMLALYFEEAIPPWKERILNDLTEVSTLLDCLEVWGVSESQLLTQLDGSFLVKWRDRS